MTCEFFNPRHPQPPASQKNQFILVNLALDVRPKVLQSFSVVAISRLKADNKDMILIFGGDYNPSRFTYLFNDVKREVTKTDIYTGDQDRYMSNQQARDKSRSETIVFGAGRIHIFSQKQRKFTGASCYDWETLDQLPEYPRDEQTIEQADATAAREAIDPLLNPESEDE